MGKYWIKKFNNKSLYPSQMNDCNEGILNKKYKLILLYNIDYTEIIMVYYEVMGH